MATHKTGTLSEEDRIFVQGEELSRSEVVKQLDRIIGSNYFRNSKRYPSFLKFVVEHTLAGNTDVLKERTLGTEVFARPSEYDTNADPVVRVTAGEIRKRIAQYYQEPGHEHELRIDLPLGSYVPHFLPAILAPQIPEHDSAQNQTDPSLVPIPMPEDEEGAREHEAAVPEIQMTPPTTAPLKTARKRKRRMLLSGVAVLLAAGVALFTVNFFHNRAKDQGTRYFWGPALSPGKPVLIVIGVHSLDSRGESLPSAPNISPTQDQKQSVLSTMQYTDMIPVSDLVSYSRITDLITHRSHVYKTSGSTNTTLEELLRGPVILIGGLDNIWTLRLTSGLRYVFYGSGSKFGIRDSRNPSTVWTVDFNQPVLDNSRDYALVASYFDPTIEQRVLIAAGIGKNGTVAAVDFLTTESYMSSWLAQAKLLPGNKNIELVLSTGILDGQPGPPHVLASYSW